MRQVTLAALLALTTAAGAGALSACNKAPEQSTPPQVDAKGEDTNAIRASATPGAATASPAAGAADTPSATTSGTPSATASVAPSVDGAPVPATQPITTTPGEAGGAQNAPARTVNPHAPTAETAGAAAGKH